METKVSMSDAGQSTNRLDRIERILEQVAATQDRLAANQQAEQQARQELEQHLDQRLDRIAANQEVLQNTVQQNSAAIAELREVTQQNSTAIAELREVTEQNSTAIAQNSTAIAELREVTQNNSTAIAQLGHQLGESVSDLIGTIDYAIGHMEQMITRAFRQGGNGSNPPSE